MARITSKNGEKLETLKSLNALSMMMTRFRLKAALLPRERRSGSKEIEKGLRAILPTSCFQSSPPSTRQFGRFLTDREVKALQEPNKGNFAYRKRAGNDVSVAKEPKDTKISSKRKHDPSPQYLDALLMEAEDTTDSVPRKKTACKGRARENLPSQVEGKISNQPEEMETAAGPLTPWEAFKSDFLDPELTSLFPEYLAGMENTPNFPEHFPEQYPSQAVAENSDQIFSGSLHAVPKPSIRNDHDWVQMESNSAIWLVDNKKVSAIHGGPTKHQCLEGPSTEAEPMTDFQPLAGMIGANRSRNMLYAGTQSPPFSQLMYNFSTEQYEPFEETSATSYGLNQYPGQDDGLFTDPGAADCYGEGSANFYQHGDMSEQSGNESLKPYLNSPDRSEQHRGLPTEDETLISLLSDFNDSHEYPAHPGYAPEKQWTLDDFINP
ncbi:hypothetical protein MMC18_006327 [Xylographa bjoerkii]|nr:hypothetical protein [Xylographa bjoerkii]